MSPLQLSHTQKLDLLIDLAHETKATLEKQDKEIAKLKTTAGRHKIILGGYGTVIGLALASLIRSFFKHF